MESHKSDYGSMGPPVGNPDHYTTAMIDAPQNADLSDLRGQHTAHLLTQIAKSSAKQQKFQFGGYVSYSSSEQNTSSEAAAESAFNEGQNTRTASQATSESVMHFNK